MQKVVQTEKSDVKQHLKDSTEKLIGGDIGREEIVQLPVDKIEPNPYQPRKYFNKTKLEELAQSIKENGVEQPAIVRKNPNPDSPFPFQMIAGERRLKASVMIGNKTIPAVIRERSDSDMRKVALLENLQRENLTYFETMMAIKDLKDEYQDNEEVSKGIGLTKRSIEQYLKLQNGLSSEPEVFAIIEKRQANLTGTLLKNTAEIIPALKRYKKADKREYERFFKRLHTKGLDKTVSGLLNKIRNNDKRNIQLPTEDTVLASKSLTESDDKLALQITLLKSYLLPSDQRREIKKLVDDFMDRLDRLAQEKPVTSSGSPV